MKSKLLGLAMIVVFIGLSLWIKRWVWGSSVPVWLKLWIVTR